MATTVEGRIDMAVFRHMLEPHIAAHLADDMAFIRDLRLHLAQTGETYLMADESKDGREHRFTLGDVR